jgi:hypothetical protein
VLPGNHADDNEPRLIRGFRRHLQPIRVIPKLLSLDEVSAVLLQVGLALGLVKLERGIPRLCAGIPCDPPSCSSSGGATDHPAGFIVKISWLLCISIF